MKKITVFSFLIASQISFAQSWYNLGSGLRPQDSLLQGNTHVNSLAVDTVNNLLYAGGDFYYAGDTVAPNFAAWDGQHWINVYPDGYPPLHQVYDLLTIGDTIIIGGKDGVTRYFDHTFHSTFHFGGTVYSLAYYHDTLYASGQLGVKKLKGKSWVPLDSTVRTGFILSMTTYKDKLVAGGEFSWKPDSTVQDIAEWDGMHWRSLEGGTRPNVFYALTSAYGDSLLIAGGSYDVMGVPGSPWIAEWDGNSWKEMPGLCGEIDALRFDSGYGLFAGGWFVLDPHNPSCNANRAAEWNGKTWVDLGFYNGNHVNYLSRYDGDLVAGGSFTYAGMSPANCIARYSKEITTSSNHICHQSIQINPNPAMNEINISFLFSNSTLVISDLTGKELEYFKIRNGNSTTLNISLLHEGVYILSIKDGKANLLASAKLFKK